ncbi:MAG: peptidoglycan DD-metalloendopeptidase family protein [Candidatus Cryptobacteroides sp.]
MKPRKTITLILACTAMLTACKNRVNEQLAEPETPVVLDSLSARRLAFLSDSLSVVEGRVRNGQFFSNLMMSNGLSAQQSYDLTQACGEVFDVRKLRVGNAYKAYFKADTLHYLVYEEDRIRSVVFACQPPYMAWAEEKPVTVERKYSDITINSSLWNDMLSAGASPLLVLDLSDIYAWTVDFFGLQKGDRFRVFYSQKVCEDAVIAIDTIQYAVFTHAGTDYPAILFDQGDEGNLYWNEKGESLRKAFLKAPLRYSRISSGFSYARKHPVTRQVRPHTGVDYAAPTGTPVMSIGDGTVLSAKYEGAGGNTIRIRHNSVYTTAYLHLSKMNVKPGQRVRQGDVIGKVGATGRCTGPHLDFRVWKNGSAINPLKMESPSCEPVADSNMAAFREVAAASAALLASQPAGLSASQPAE